MSIQGQVKLRFVNDKHTARHYPAKQDQLVGDKWKNGTLIIKAFDHSVKSKEIPIDTFFHKIVMVRDRIRVMEQRINSSSNLDVEEKFNLQQYITRIYGSLTTFNVLFKYKDDHFIGDKTK